MSDNTFVGAMKDLAATVSSKFSEITHDRCEKCPAFWENVDYWGEYDAGCSIHRDHLEFCPLSLVPHPIMRPYVKFRERQEEKYWERLAREESEKWSGDHDQHS